MPDDAEIIPPLRSDIEWETDPANPGGGARLSDPRLGRKLKIDRRGCEIARLLDRTQTPDELRRRIAEVTGVPIAAEALARVLGAFAGLGLLDSAAAEAAAAEKARQREEFSERREDIPLLIAPGLRFTCAACGSCCHGTNIGPVSQAVVDRLHGEKHDELVRVTRTQKGLFFSMIPDGEADETLVCQQRNGSCVFLEGDGLCAIHRRWGPGFKPDVCRFFPFLFTMTPRGIAIGLQVECRDILRASLGQPVAEQEADLRTLIALFDKMPSARAFVSLDGVATMPYDEYEALEDEVCAAVEATPGGGFDLVRAAGRVVAGRCAAAGRPFPAGEVERGALRQAFYALVQDVGNAMVQLRSEHRVEEGGVKLHGENLDMIVEALSDTPLFADLIFAPDPDPETERFARLVLKNHWRAKEFLHPANLVHGMALFGLAWFVVRALAFSRARQVHRRLPTAQDHVDAWVATHMAMRNKRVAKVLQPLHEAVASTFMHRLDALVEMRDELVDIEKRTEFYIF